MAEVRRHFTEDAPAGPTPPSGRGPDAAGSPPQPAAAPGAASPALRGTRGPKRADGVAHPAASSALKPAPGRPSSDTPGAGCGKDGPPAAPASREAVPGAPVPGTAPTSPRAAEGPARGERREEPGATGVGAGPSPSEAPARDGHSHASLAGQEFRKAWQAARSADAKARRTGHGRYPVKRAGDGCRPGMTRRPPS